MPLGFGAMMVIVFFLFKALRQPVIIRLTVPLALICVVYGLIVPQTTMEFVAIHALLSLTGMPIKNAIVLIDETDYQIREGKARFEAVVDAAVSRVRPVTVGVLTTARALVVVPTPYAVFFKVRLDEST